MDRIAALKRFIESSPDDPFPRYGLAMEYKNRGMLAEAIACFDELATRCPDYVATYLMYGNALADHGDRDAARDVYQRGIARASAAGDGKTRGELQDALAELR